MSAEGRPGEAVRVAGHGATAFARLRSLTPERVRTWFCSDAASAAVAWFAAVVVLVAVLGWFSCSLRMARR